MLPVTALAAVTLAPFLFEDEDLLCLGLAQNFAQHFGIGNLWYSNLNVVVATDKQNVLERHLLPYLAGEFLDLDDIALADAVLLPARSNHSILHKFFPRLNV